MFIQSASILSIHNGLFSCFCTPTEETYISKLGYIFTMQSYSFYDPIIATTIACYVHSQSAIEINKPLSAKDIIDILPKIIQKNFKIN